ncbi:MAG: hypothetical protein B6D46_01550 [Polyangiaceae bacterium UTPRO1]|jgi:alkylation response protein AidB-like acyl-CoA dehydrogenase|nr:acyl-CoA/acyl-ACP dehydrogenase [Myxococcales bacterium]OQY69030.1 MAG: hypothetical protein B6D46_01550 [Polyangiaceae bacterium UTPRO1]
MDFGFSLEQEMLRASARKLLDAHCPPELPRAMLADATAHDAALWRRLSGLGLTGVLLPAEHGGQGGTLLDLVLVLEEMGKALVPGPYFASTVLGGLTVARGGSPEQRAAMLPALANGERRAALVLAVAHGPERPSVQLRAESAGDTYRLRGNVPFVMDAHVADTLIVPAATGDGPTLFALTADTAGVAVTQLRTVDMTRRLCAVALDATVPATAVLGRPGEAAPALEHAVRHATVGLAVEALGVAQRALDLSVAYAKERTQFGRPIGSFQAVKHKCVDMMVGIETARSLAYYAAWAVTEDAADAASSVAMAKAYASDVAVTVTSEAIQVHGGIGFTWEHDIHLYHRRALATSAAFGSPVAQRETVATMLPILQATSAGGTT